MMESFDGIVIYFLHLLADSGQITQLKTVQKEQYMNWFYLSSLQSSAIIHSQPYLILFLFKGGGMIYRGWLYLTSYWGGVADYINTHKSLQSPLK